MEFKEIQKLVYTEYIKNGYLESWNYPTIHNLDNIIQNKFDIAELALISSEVSEAIEEIRNKEFSIPLFGFELGDIAIRTFNISSRKKIDLESFILAKHEKNIKREYLHGRNI